MLGWTPSTAMLHGNKTDMTADEQALTVKQYGHKSEPTISHTSFITADSQQRLSSMCSYSIWLWDVTPPERVHCNTI